MQNPYRHPLSNPPPNGKGGSPMAGVVRWAGRGTRTGGVIGSTDGGKGPDGVQGAGRERSGAWSSVEAASPATLITPATPTTPFTPVAKSTGGRAGRRRDWWMLALAASTPFPLSSSPPLRPSLFPRQGAATRQRDGGRSIGGLARGPFGGFVGGRVDSSAGGSTSGSVGGLAGALVGGPDGGSIGGFPGRAVGGLAGALVGETNGGSLGGFAGGSAGVLAGRSVPGVSGAFMACAVACVAGNARATGLKWESAHEVH
ncbi:unnamed protein product [Closterium sp. Naga37s-1]|nr:unnamed protein product [Closterium sp. Naga37s-1]